MVFSVFILVMQLVCQSLFKNRLNVYYSENNKQLLYKVTQTNNPTHRMFLSVFSIVRYDQIENISIYVDFL